MPVGLRNIFGCRAVSPHWGDDNVDHGEHDPGVEHDEHCEGVEHSCPRLLGQFFQYILDRLCSFSILSHCLHLSFHHQSFCLLL